ncbi:nitrile hydratase accessory protein [Ruegeria halocynthiae]|uniref:nitrile hydratase accessory protein n=1 Tax=Ruegeria halocynthiae TaxID=985054 RepID=UPI00068BBF51|nr:nitrile hydratase accessory protein [Ruegeria halocynthiae]
MPGEISKRSALSTLPEGISLPGGTDEPVFREPWEARIFAIVVALHDQGRFDWSVFQKRLIARLNQAEGCTPADAYYEGWYAAAQDLIAELDLATEAEVEARANVLRPDDRTVTLPRAAG